VALDTDDDGWFAALRPLDGAPIRVQYQGKNRFLVQSSAGVRDVHQGDPASVREGSGETHQLTLRLYRQPPRESPAPTKRIPPDPETGTALGARLDGQDEG
jgi:hypothetical protein